MLARMDAHALLGDVALYSALVGDGGPRACRRRGKELPEKYLPGRFLAGLHPEVRTDLVRAVNDQTTSPAPWFLRYVVDEEDPRAALPPPPVDRRWSCRGRWSMPSTARVRKNGGTK